MPNEKEKRRISKKILKPEKTVDLCERASTSEKIARVEGKRLAFMKEVHHCIARRHAKRVAMQKSLLQNESREKQKNLKYGRTSWSEKMMMKVRETMSDILENGIKSVYTSTILREKIKFDGKRMLSIKGTRYTIKNNLHIVGWGTEAVCMSAELERIVGKQLRRGFIVVPRGTVFRMWNFPSAFPKLDSRLRYLEAGSEGLPDRDTVEISSTIIQYCKKLKRKDLLLIFLSKEIDDLLCCPRAEISLKGKLRLLGRLKEANATEDEIATVRNKLSMIRGGDLARIAFPARVVVLLTSDVFSSPVITESLGGGPTIYDRKDSTALSILTKYGLASNLSGSIRDVIEESLPRAVAADKQLDKKKNYKFVDEYVVASNADAMEAMALNSKKFGFFPIKLNPECLGTVRYLAKEYAKMASLMILGVERKIQRTEMYEAMRESRVCFLSDERVKEIFPDRKRWGLGLCLLFGGRPSVNLCSSPGRGGANQELALYFAIFWQLRCVRYPILQNYTVWFLGGATSGRDGNSPAVGAFGYRNLSTDIYDIFKKIESEYKSAHREWQKLDTYDRKSIRTKLAQQKLRELEVIRDKYRKILPDRVLEYNNTYHLYENINNGEDIVYSKSGNLYTYTDVGDLHIIRIARFECNCNGLCFDSTKVLGKIQNEFS